MSIAYLGTLMVGCVIIGWCAGRRAPIGIEYKVWLKYSRRLSRWRRAVS